MTISIVMRQKYLYLLPFFVLLLLSKVSVAQQITADNLAQLNQQQDSLAIMGQRMYDATDDLEKIAVNTAFVKKLVTALKTPFSFQHNLEAVYHISIQKSPDQTFRIITWSLPLNDGTYKFYGTIQFATKDGSLKIIPLTDNTLNISDDNVITNSKNWYGARYYDMIPVSFVGKPTYYILLGWKGNNNKTTKKVIEILSFDKDEPLFGKNVFEMGKNQPIRNRVVFEYNKKNSMTLAYDKNVNMVVFDHLAPYEPNMVGNFEYYGSDLSFNGYMINHQKLYLKENVPLKNEASSLDELYATPRKATTLLQKVKQ